jgi:Fur family peroxide stress response transcriptional regulator
MRPDPIERFIVRCRAAGLSVTPQRLAVYRHLAAEAGHPSAEELHAQVRRELPTLSLATVYKTLERLARIGAVRRVSRAGARSRWDAGGESHHHLVCIECGKVSDVLDARLDALRGRAGVLAGRQGFEVTGHVVDIFGRCAECRRDVRSARAARRGRQQRHSHGGKR